MELKLQLWETILVIKYGEQTTHATPGNKLTTRPIK